MNNYFNKKNNINKKNLIIVKKITDDLRFSKYHPHIYIIYTN